MLNFTGYFTFNNLNYLVNVFHKKDSNSLFCTGTSFFLNLISELEKDDSINNIRYLDNFTEHNLDIKFIDSKLISGSLFFHFEIISSSENNINSKINAVCNNRLPGLFSHNEELNCFVFSIEKNFFEKIDVHKIITITFTHFGTRINSSYIIDFIESNSYDSVLNLFLHKIS